MEGSADVSVSEPVEHSVAAPHIKRKENDEQRPQQRDTDNALENAAQVTIPRSPENFMETLAGKDLSHDQGSASDPGMMVEELTLNNYKSPILFKGEGSSVKKGFWSNFTRLAGEPRGRDASLRSSSIGYREGVGSLFMPQMSMGRPPVSTQLEPSPSKVADHLAESDHRIASRSMLDKPMEGIRTKVLPASGFSQFFVKNSLRRKGVAYKHPGIRKGPWGVTQSRNNLVRSSNDAEVDTHSSEQPSGKRDDKTLIGGGGQADTPRDEISLREWLTPRLHKLDKFERLQIFKQILELVDTSHSQGLILQCLRPTYILISPSNQVKYVGAFVPRSQMEQLEGQHNQNIENYLEPHLKRKKYWWHDDNSSSTMHQKLGESYKPHVLSGGSALQQPTFEFLKLEEKWYASPGELNMGTCSFSSNIYSLGVLLFELFCYFDTWELHSAAMSDLRYRILPPNFLSESPKEAGFCLWLLHPESSSRPNSRDILLSNFVSEGQDLLSPDDSAAIDEEDAEADLLLHFLLSMKEQKEKQAAKLEADVQCLTGDIEEVERRYSSRTESLPTASGLPVYFNEISDKFSLRRPAHGEGTSWFSTSTLKEERLIGNLDQLENAYFSMRSKIEPSESDSVSRSDSDVLRIRNGRFQVQNDTDVWKEPTDSLGSFFEGLCKYARYSKFELCGSLRSVDILNSANVICSLSFDRDEDYFAAAGVSKKIKIFEFGALLNDSVDIHYPLIEMSNRSKLSCVCWNNYIKNYLASTDYEGVVQLWDASTGQGFTQYIEHQKRAWSVDFSIVDPTRLASGSDDCSVKLWSINERNCTDTIRNVANVCCVQFSPYSSHLLAFGSADYKTYCFDLRMTRVPWCTLGGHGKAVSYVKFVDSVTAVSASTDNSLKLWDLNKTNPSGLSTNACTLSFSGHTNEKNFVGLSVSDGYITCGSETNEVYAYYRTLPMPITSHKFGSTDPITGQETDDDNGQFVSSVCWRKRSNMVIAANSAGTIKLLQMV